MIFWQHARFIQRVSADSTAVTCYKVLSLIHVALCPEYIVSQIDVPKDVLGRRACHMLGSYRFHVTLFMWYDALSYASAACSCMIYR